LYHKFRVRIYQLEENINIINYGKFHGEIEIDEAYFGTKRICGKHGRGAGKKVHVIGLLIRNSKVYLKS